MNMPYSAPKPVPLHTSQFFGPGFVNVKKTKTTSIELVRPDTSEFNYVVMLCVIPHGTHTNRCDLRCQSSTSLQYRPHSEKNIAVKSGPSQISNYLPGYLSGSWSSCPSLSSSHFITIGAGQDWRHVLDCEVLACSWPLNFVCEILMVFIFPWFA